MRRGVVFGMLLFTSFAATAHAAKYSCNSAEIKFAAYKYWFNQFYAKKFNHLPIVRSGAIEAKGASLGTNVSLYVGPTNLGAALAYSWVHPYLRQDAHEPIVRLARSNSSTLGFTVHLCGYAWDEIATPKDQPTPVRDYSTAGYYKIVSAKNSDGTDIIRTVSDYNRSGRFPGRYESTRRDAAWWTARETNVFVKNMVFIAVLEPESMVRTFEGQLRISYDKPACIEWRSSGATAENPGDCKKEWP